ncbi:hypothetical protein YT1_3887 [Rhodococcus ruber]|nr:hypothetical protein YT1_3887 [Rhodococcus ruber]
MRQHRRGRPAPGRAELATDGWVDHLAVPSEFRIRCARAHAGSAHRRGSTNCRHIRPPRRTPLRCRLAHRNPDDSRRKSTSSPFHTKTNRATCSYVQ